MILTVIDIILTTLLLYSTAAVVQYSIDMLLTNESQKSIEMQEQEVHTRVGFGRQRAHTLPL
jgi:hypothetical protein